MWFSGQIALGWRGCCCRDLCCVVYSDNVCRLRLSCSCWIWCGTGYSGGILTEDVNVKASILANKGNNTGNKTSWLFHDLPQFFFLSSAIICCLSLLSGLIPPAHFLKASSCRTSNLCHMFSLKSHPALSIFILDSITFLVSAETRFIQYCSAMRVAAPQIYVGAEGWLSHFLHG